MLKKYKIRYAVICALLASFVFFGACLFAFQLAKASIINDSDRAFDTQCMAIDSLLSAKQVDLSKLYEIQKSSELSVDLFENGNSVALLVPDSINTKEQIRSEMQIQLAYDDIDFGKFPDAYIAKNYNIRILETNYLIKYLSYETNSNNWRTIIFSSSQERQQQLFIVLATNYSLYFFIGIIIIVLLSLVLAHYSVKPLEAAINNQREFTAMASHELKTPLAVISSSAQMIELDSNNTSTYIQTINEESNKMSRLVMDLLFLSNSNASHLNYQKKPTNIEALFFSLYEKFVPIARNNKHSLDIKTPNYNVPEIFADSIRIEQAFGIILNNAIEHTPANTKIVMKLEVEHSKIVVSIIDNGFGMGYEEKKRAFDKFYQGSSSANSSQHFGLGLPIAYEIFHAHNYTVSLFDTADGGLTVSTSMPAKKNTE